MNLLRCLAGAVALPAVLGSVFVAPAWSAGSAQTAAGPAEAAPAEASVRPVEAFGVESFTSAITTESGAPATQAGSHPYALTTAVTFDHVAAPSEPEQPPEVRTYGDPRDIVVGLPPGLIVDPRATESRCTEAELESGGTGCPNAAAVGVFSVYVSGFQAIDEPVYNMIPPAGVPAELGFDVGGIGLIVHVGGTIRAGLGGDAVSAEISDISQEHAIYGLELTLWGDPSAASHDAERGQCAGEKAKQRFKRTGVHELCPVERTATPFLTLPTSCAGQPLATTLSVDSWQQPGDVSHAGAPDLSDPRWQTSTSSSPAVTGCDELAFTPSLDVVPTPPPPPAESPATESPSGLDFDLRIPREEVAEGLSEAALRQLTVMLPAGLAISPSAAGGLQACAPGATEPGEPGGESASSCPESAKVGTLEVLTPLLESPLHGAVYLAQPDLLQPNPLAPAQIGLYLEAGGDGVQIELGATASLDPSTGQITLTLDDLPQLPLSAVHLDLFGGPRAVLQTPPNCGAYTTASRLTSWSGASAESSSTFTIASGCAHGFAPSFLAGTSDPRAGASSPFSVTLSRHDGEQQLGTVRIVMPPGLIAALGSVPPCPEPLASTGACPSASQIGEATLAAGPGPDPYWLTGGRIYLTGPTLLEGPDQLTAPFGLAIVVPATAGPFDLGQALVRARVELDSHTAQVTISSDPLPTILRGVPLDLRTLDLTIDRAGAPFIVNPTDCSPLTVTATIGSSAGASAAVSSPYEATDCASLSFEPSFTASTQAHTSKSRGASLTVHVASAPGQANIGKVRVILPARLTSRLTTLQHACPQATFDADPASCPAFSVVGSATADTRVLADPLSGPAYLVSRGGAAFPDLVFVLQGAGIVMYLDGNTDIRGHYTSSTFASIPDVPIDTFTATFPEGPHSMLAAALPARARGSLCGHALYMPTEITAQDGALQTRTTRISVTGCGRGRTGGSGRRDRSMRIARRTQAGRVARRVQRAGAMAGGRVQRAGRVARRTR